MGATTGSLYVSYGQYHLCGSEFDTEQWDPSRSSGLVIALREPGLPSVPGDFAVVLTGTNSGTIKVTLDLRGSEPQEDTLADWDEVAEVSLRVADDDLFSLATVDEADEDDEFPEFPPGNHRVRVHARGRASARSSSGSGPEVEEHLIIVWPEPPSSEKVLKQSSEQRV